MAMRPPPGGMTHKDIAEVVGCSWQYIWMVERAALKKLAKKRVLREWAETPLETPSEPPSYDLDAFLGVSVHRPAQGN